MIKIAIIGGGPAGMLAAASAADAGAQAFLYEKNEKLGKKLFLTGKGRCNITNSARIDEFFMHIPRNPKFLYSAFNAFNNQDMVSLLDGLKVPTKVERGGRVFPASDKSSDVLRALSEYCAQKGVLIRLSSNVLEIKRAHEGFIVITHRGEEKFNAVILATGGLSYPQTGSTGDGYRFARGFGHGVETPRASLVPLETEESWPAGLAGLSLKNVRLTAYQNKRAVFDEVGEMLFTHFGVSGPLVLSASSRVADNPKGALLSVDMKPGLNEEELDRRILRDFTANTRKLLANTLYALLPGKMIPVIIGLSGIDPKKPVDQITKAERRALLSLLKALPLTISGARPIDEAVITRGGVNIREINASTMESKRVPGLYFAGELLDVDGYTGGYNLQIAYSTGFLAGKSAAGGEEQGL